MNFAEKLRETTRRARGALLPGFIEAVKEAATRAANAGSRRLVYQIPQSLSTERSGIETQLKAEGFQRIKFSQSNPTWVEFRW